ncbi:MAG TPA: UDP-N-acetylmuramoyl-L-alanyl-D-glutamate--2,6-diaminopimelate ligase [Methylibium sp.]|nr:UDP-N-acetylmuramoyl-L-alanyl-D-glutamate--2,6-diaminopimelate ligase [Methylibium sp.]
MLMRLRSPAAAARWLRSWVTGTLRTDSRRVQPGDGFIAWPGHATDGRRYVQAALDAGAATVLVEAEGVETYGFEDARIGALPRLKAATGAIADAYFEHPTERLRVVATTGTNGKTSTAWWTAQALTLLGQRCGVVGTLGVGVPPVGDAGASIEFTGLTTPDPVTLHAGFRRMADAGFAACAIEASSIGLVEERLAATRIEVALFTNFTRDHLDFHGDMAAYWAAKRRLFDWPGLEAASINIDDAEGAALADELEAGSLELWTCSLANPKARLRASGLGYADGGLGFTLHEGDVALPLRSTLIGDYNASNLLVVIGGLRALGVPLEDAVRVVPQLTPVPGRMQRVMTAPRSPGTATTPPGGGEPGLGRPGAWARDGLDAPEVVVDYAHTPDALEKVLGALRPLAAARGGRLVCVFGCGGNRDATKRPLMGAIAQRLADRVIVTSDNPRGEPPAAILEQIVAGQDRRDRATVIEDRRAAIAAAVAQAGPRDVLLIAGKGHEDYQEIAGVKHPFSDVDEAAHALAARAGAAR